MYGIMWQLLLVLPVAKRWAQRRNVCGTLWVPAEINFSARSNNESATSTSVHNTFARDVLHICSEHSFKLQILSQAFGIGVKSLRIYFLRSICYLLYIMQINVKLQALRILINLDLISYYSSGT